ncbi:unnamed protein product, partial [Brassica rapa]
ITKISDLPVNLVEEILYKIPLKSMRTVRLTCKECDTLSKNRSFSKMHIGKLRAVKEGESLMIAMIDYNLYLMKVTLVDNENPFIECKVFHCDGLLLCVLDDDDTKAIVWNPYWCQTRRDMFSYALGYEDKGSCPSYKFLRFIDQCVDYKTRDEFLWYEIYDFDSSLWKSLDITPHWRILCHQPGVSLKGNTYWPASQRNTNDVIDDHIICFDFTSESFGPLLRLPFDAGDEDYVTLSYVREEKLAVLLTHNEAGPMEFEIWITTKIEAEKVLWSKFLRVLEPDHNSLITGDSFFIDEDKKVAMGFEEDYSKTFNIAGEAGYYKKLKFVERLGGNIHCRAKACSYVPSLVQIKQPAAVGKRKHQNDLEKQRCDQNMSSLVSLNKRGTVWW